MTTVATMVSAALLVGAGLGPAPVLAQGAAPARVTFGEDRVVREGERVAALVTMGGDAIVRGEVVGDVVTMGGDVDIPGEVGGNVATMGGDAAVDGRVDGDVVTMGGALRLGDGAHVRGETVTAGGALHHADGARVEGRALDNAPPMAAGLLGSAGGPFAAFGDWLVDLVSGVVSFGLLFLLGLFLMGLTSERFGALQVTIVRQPLRSALLGVAGMAAGAIAIVVLAITLIGIPAAVLLGMLLPIAAYVGLAACAQVIGAALPVTTLRGKPVLQLAAGVAALFVASLVPLAGSVALAVATLVGLGALVATRFGAAPPPAGPPQVPAGPYRTPVV